MSHMFTVHCTKIPIFPGFQLITNDVRCVWHPVKNTAQALYTIVLYCLVTELSLCEQLEGYCITCHWGLCWFFSMGNSWSQTANHSRGWEDFRGQTAGFRGHAAGLRGPLQVSEAIPQVSFWGHPKGFRGHTTGFRRPIPKVSEAIPQVSEA